MMRWLLLGLILTVPARAAELTVLSAGASNGVAKAVVPAFQSRTGVTVILRTDTVGALVRRIAGGERFDVVMMSPAGLAELAKAGKIAPGSTVTLAHVGIGVGVKAGAPMPDISTVETFKAALLHARAIAYVDPASGGSSGIYLAKLFQTWGIGAALAPKSVLIRGGLAAETLLDGRADLAMQQISEIMAVSGVTVVGPLPGAIQNQTTYAGALAADDADRGDATDFLAAMAGPAVQPLLEARGMTAP
jgi:molybdate transport system substrate-binding protein